jgi:predicted transcriptional regulator of viral defense system
MNIEVARRLRTQVGSTFRATEAVKAGMHWRDLYELRDAGEIVELSRGLYRFANAETISGLDLLAVCRRAPHGMICLTSALAHWDLTDEIPRRVHLAVPRGASRPTIDYPPTAIHVFAAATFDLGQKIVEISPGEAITITDPERTVVDAFRFRNRLGHDLAHKALRSYLRTPGSNPSRVATFAKRLRVEGPVKHSLQILLA